MFVIQKNVPIAPSRRKPRMSRYSFIKEMEIGDSVLVNEKQASAIYSAAKYFGIKTTRRKVEGGVRVWRV